MTHNTQKNARAVVDSSCCDICRCLVLGSDSLKQPHASVVYQRSKIIFVGGDACQATITYEVTSVQGELSLMYV
jgi:hypothetical protein